MLRYEPIYEDRSVADSSSDVDDQDDLDQELPRGEPFCIDPTAIHGTARKEPEVPEPNEAVEALVKAIRSKRNEDQEASVAATSNKAQNVAILSGRDPTEMTEVEEEWENYLKDPQRSLEALSEVEYENLFRSRIRPSSTEFQTH